MVFLVFSMLFQLYIIVVYIRLRFRIELVEYNFFGVMFFNENLLLVLK